MQNKKTEKSHLLKAFTKGKMAADENIQNNVAKSRAGHLPPPDRGDGCRLILCSI
jgi:hypothetical protein